MYTNPLQYYFQQFTKYPFVRSYDHSITYGAVWEDIEIYTRKLSSFEGKQVSIITVPSVETLTILCTLIRLDAQIILLSPFDPPPTIYKYLSETQTKFLLCPKKYVDKYILSPIPIFTFEDIKNSKANHPPFSSSNEECKFIIMTSGSTSSPKKVCLSFTNLLTNAYHSNKNLPFQVGDTWLLSLPLFHVSGLSILFRAIVGGGSVYIPDENINWWSHDIPDDITHLSVVSTLMKRLLDRKDGLMKNKWESILLGGGPIPEGIVRKCCEMGLPLYTTYGLTEMASQVTTTSKNDNLSHLLTSGKPLIPDTVKIGEDGNIHVRGPCRFQGYWNNDTLEQPFDEEGWFATQDMGQWTEDGYLQVLGRKDNIFICGGENIQPEEIENEILSSGFVNRVVVVPMEDAEYGCVPVAFVEFSEDRDEKDLVFYLKERISGIKIPKHYFPFPKKWEEKGIKISRRALANGLQTQKEVST